MSPGAPVVKLAISGPISYRQVQGFDRRLWAFRQDHAVAEGGQDHRGSRPIRERVVFHGKEKHRPTIGPLFGELGKEIGAKRGITVGPADKWSISSLPTQRPRKVG